MPRRAQRSFTPEFKAPVVLDLLRGERSQAERRRRHQLSTSLPIRWKDAFLERLPFVFQADEQRSQERQRIADLEQLVGRQALELKILKQASRLLNGPANAGGRSS